MRLLNPSGLWLLLGIPVLIVIYLIRSHHEDRPVSSTFIWKLSSRFMKKRLPLQKLRRALVFVLQLLMIVFLSLMVAKPAMVTGKSTQYIAIIDSSASMQIKDDDGVSRFDRALEQVRELSSCVDQGHSLSVVLAGDKASYLLQNSQSANSIRLALNRAVCGYGSCDIDSALDLILPLQQKGPTKLFFYTDQEHTGSRNIRIHNLNENEWNISLDALSFAYTEEGESYPVGLLTSHNRDADLYVGLRVDGNIHSAYSVHCPADTQIEVAFSSLTDDEFEVMELFIDQNDGLAADNSLSICKGYQRMYKVLVVSSSPLYLNTALGAIGNCAVTAINGIDDSYLSGYDLYIFDGIYPQKYPTDGSILQFGTEFLPRGVTTMGYHDVPTSLTKGQMGHALYADLTLYDTTVRRYTALSGGGKWEPVLYCGKSIVCMTKVEDSGQRFTVLGFDLHDSNLPMQTDYVVLMRNILEHSVFDLLDKTDFAMGEDVSINILPAATGLYVQQPDGTAVELSVQGAASAFVPEAPGVHTAVLKTETGGEYANFFVHIPQGEVQSLPGESVNAGEGIPGTQDALTQLWPYIAAVLLLLLLAEWGVYHYEQY